MVFPSGVLAAGRRRSASAYTAEAVDFDGTNDYMTRTTGLSASDNKTGTISFWVNHAGSGNTVILCSSTDGVAANYRMYAQIGTAGNLAVLCSSASATVLNVSCPVSSIPDNQWSHIMLSFDLSDTGKRAVYIDGQDPSPTWAVYTNSNTIWSANHWRVGDWWAGGQKINGDLSELFFTNEYIDLSVASNRRKFSSQDGNGGIPVDLGSDGSTPTGTQPLIYFKGEATTWNAGTNAGSGGDFTMTGAVTDSSNEPVEVGT